MTALNWVCPIVGGLSVVGHGDGEWHVAVLPVG